jgi:peptidyl-prolyl cis-trans isomerase A (cyclophilin A)
MKINLSAAIAGLAIVAMAAVAGAQSSSPQTKTPAPAKPAARSTAFDPALLHPSTLTATAPPVYYVKFETTEGDFTVQVTRAWAPHGADRFYNLVKHGFFNGDAFFRVIPHFMAQFGLTPYPEVNRVWYNANIPDDHVTHSNTRGMVTFAATGAPNSRSTQLFINFVNNAGLDGQGFAPFGEVISGMDVVDKIYSGYGDTPDQGRVTAQGKAYLDANFPRLTIIKTARIVPAPPATPTPNPARR